MGTDGSVLRQEIIEKLRNFIGENFLMFAGVETFRDSDSFLELGIIDSTGILELLEFVERAFAIHVNDDETVPENLDSLDNLSAFIIRKGGLADRPCSPRIDESDGGSSE